MSSFPDSSRDDENPEHAEANEPGFDGMTPTENVFATTPTDPADYPHESSLVSYADQPVPGEPAFIPRLVAPPRFPNFTDVGILLILLFFGWIGGVALAGIALHFHLFGVRDIKAASTDVHYSLGAQAAWYLISFGLCALMFPAIWHRRFFSGVEWRARVALHSGGRLISAAFACFALAIVDSLAMPGPADTPIDEVFRKPGAAWLLFAFGVTLAPFFEEMIYRGFLLPAFCTAWDWSAERLQNREAPWPDAEGKIRWSLPAMFVGSLLTSIPFALMHAEQTGYSLGPFLLLVCVSLVLCWVRLSTRSLAASTLVHSSYNLLLFSLMLAGTGGFKHLDKM
jgi:hypothetical protein